MEMIKDRLLHIMRSKNLTASQFADLMQVQPSNISHLLSGRNKPSIDFLIKLKETFPEYSFDWIILGKKPITLSKSEQFLEKKEIPDEKIYNSKSDSFNLFSPTQQESQLETESIEKATIPNDVPKAKEPVKIILVYSDNSFEILNKKSQSML